MAKIKDKLQGGVTKVKEFYSGDNKKKRIGVTALALALVIAISVFTAAKLNQKEYVSLFTDLTADDLSSVVTKLEEQGVTDYKIKDDSILVNSKEENSIRADLLFDGYPKSGFAYETYNSQLSMMTSESARKTAELQDLQDRIGATIECFDGVKQAVVNIQTGSDSRYVLDSENAVPASASVFVTMKNNEEISEKYVEAIGNLISTSVSGLEFENISVTDSFGNTFVPGELNSEESTSGASDLKLRLEQQVNNRVRNEVLQALTPVYGDDNVKVSVNSTVDVSRKVQESVTYTTPEGANPGEGIIGHYEYDQSLSRPTDEQAAGGVAGAETNTDTNTDIDTYLNTQGAVQGNEDVLTNSGVKDFNVNTQTEQSEQNFGVVTDVMIAVTINEAVSGNVGAEQLVSHIARAAGIQPDQQADKINVLIAPFYDPNAQDNTQNDNNGIIGGFTLPSWGIYVIGALVGLLLVLIILLIIIKKRRKKARLIAEQEAQAKAEAEQKALEEEIFKKAALSEAERLAEEEAAKRDILDIQNERNLELKQDIRKFTEENPEIAASMLRTWLRGEGGETNGG